MIKKHRCNVLIIYNKYWSYREPIFDILGEKYNLTVAYSIGDRPQEAKNHQIIHLPIFKFSRFVIHKNNLSKISKNYDVVIAYGDISWLSLIKLGFIKRSFGLIYWTIGVRASYENHFNKKTIWDHLRFYIYSKSDALIIYSEKPLERYNKRGWNLNKIFVANNTVRVEPNYLDFDKKEKLIFIGTLYKEKGIEILLQSYLSASKLDKAIPILDIIGGGEGLSYVKDFVKIHNLQEKVFVHGPIFDEKIIKTYFELSIACISPNQAGLSVLKSMGYGVPFITNEKAITGGEIYNIINGVNGVLYKKQDELVNILLEINSNKDKYLLMGKEAKAFYDKNRKPGDMAQGIIDSVEFVKFKNKS